MQSMEVETNVDRESDYNDADMDLLKKSSLCSQVCLLGVCVLMIANIIGVYVVLKDQIDQVKTQVDSVGNRGYGRVVNGRRQLLLMTNEDIPNVKIGARPKQEFEGFLIESIKGIQGELENVDISVIEGPWSDCWTGSTIGPGLKNDAYDGCTDYFNNLGAKNRYFEFSESIIDKNAAGLITRLEGGKPVISGKSDLSGIRVGDVQGWAPGESDLPNIKNVCTGLGFKNYTIVYPTVSDPDHPHDAVIKMLKNKEVDAILVGGNDAANFQCSTDPNVIQTWNCSLWSGFGTEYAYFQTGMTDYLLNSTTITMSKKGSGVPDIVNPGIRKFMKTKDYYDLCVKYNLTDLCYKNDYFTGTAGTKKPGQIKTENLSTLCLDGYCQCNVSPYTPQ